MSGSGEEPSSGGAVEPVSGQLEATRAEIERLDRAEVRRALQAAEEKASRHLVWAALGLSPAALIPFVGFLIEGSVHLIWPLIVLVFFAEGGRYWLAQREVQRLREVLRRMRTETLDPFEEPVVEGER